MYITHKGDIPSGISEEKWYKNVEENKESNKTNKRNIKKHTNKTFAGNFNN